MKPLLSFKKSVFKTRKLNTDLKIKRNRFNYNEYLKLKTNKTKSKFYNDFITDAKTKSTPIIKNIFNGKPYLASKEYLTTIKEYKNYLNLSGVSKEHISNFINSFKKILFKNIISNIKKEVPKKVILNQSLISESNIKEIKTIENKLINDLFNLGFIKDTTKQNIRFSNLNSIESISFSNIVDNNPNKLFKDIFEIYSSLKKGQRSKVVDDLVKGKSRVVILNEIYARHTISINTNHKQVKHIIIHELIHSYLKREYHFYARNEVVVEFLTNLLSSKYFNTNYKRKSSSNFVKNQYYVGFSLYQSYVKKYGLNFSNVDKFLKENKSFILKNSIN